MADIFYTDAPTIDGDPYPWEMPQTARPRRRLRNWQKFILTYDIIIAGLALILSDVVLRTGGNRAGSVAVAVGVAVVAGLAQLMAMYAAWRLDRL
jgi:hypothetical protein